MTVIALMVAAVLGVTVDRVEFPAPHEFVQAGQKTALLVFASDFAVQVHLTVSEQRFS